MKRETNFVNLLIWAAVVAIVLMFIPQAKAQAWDAAADFTPGENSANVWTWGWRDQWGNFTAMVPVERDHCGIYGGNHETIPGFDCFTGYDSSRTLPQILKNNSGHAQRYKPPGGNPSNVTLGQNVLFLRPGISPDGSLRMYPVIRFTAQKPGTYDFLASAQLVDKSAVPVVFHMTGQTEKRMEAFGDARHFQPVYDLKAGESIDAWVVPVGSIFFATTAVRMSVMRR